MQANFNNYYGRYKLRNIDLHLILVIFNTIIQTLKFLCDIIILNSKLNFNFCIIMNQYESKKNMINNHLLSF